MEGTLVVGCGNPLPTTSVPSTGCGNPLRGDDAAGPELVRRLVERGLPAGVRCIDAGTGGIDAVLSMRGADDVIVVDACRSGGDPGALFEISGDEASRSPPSVVALHAVRWDHAVALARGLLGPDAPRRITVWLVEAASFEPGAPLSPAVDRAVDELARRVLERSHAAGVSDRVATGT